MSESDKEDAKQVAVEAVREHLELSDKTRIRTSIKNAVAIVGTVIAGTIAVCTYLNKMSNTQDRIEAGLNHKVSVSAFAEWAAELDHANRQTVPLLVVPRIPQPEDKSSH